MGAHNSVFALRTPSFLSLLYSLLVIEIILVDSGVHGGAAGFVVEMLTDGTVVPGVVAACLAAQTACMAA